MKNFIKNKKKFYSLIFIIIFILIAITIIINISNIRNYQAYVREETRKKDLEYIKSGIEEYINKMNNCPRTSNPVPHTYLPQLILEDGYLKGGVPVFTLEDINNFINPNRTFDPKGTPYFIGIKDNLIYVYSNEMEIEIKKFDQHDSIKNLNVSIDANLCLKTNE